MIDLVQIQKQFDEQLNAIAAKLSDEDRVKFNEYRNELKEVTISKSMSFEQKQLKILEIQRKYGY